MKHTPLFCNSLQNYISLHFRLKYFFYLLSSVYLAWYNCNICPTMCLWFDFLSLFFILFPGGYVSSFCLLLLINLALHSLFALLCSCFEHYNDHGQLFNRHPFVLQITYFFFCACWQFLSSFHFDLKTCKIKYKSGRCYCISNIHFCWWISLWHYAVMISWIILLL
jgi:hypothetical protein